MNDEQFDNYLLQNGIKFYSKDSNKIDFDFPRLDNTYGNNNFSIEKYEDYYYLCSHIFRNEEEDIYRSSDINETFIAALLYSKCHDNDFLEKYPQDKMISDEELKQDGIEQRKIDDYYYLYIKNPYEEICFSRDKDIFQSRKCIEVLRKRLSIVKELYNELKSNGVFEIDDDFKYDLIKISIYLNSENNRIVRKL